MGFSDDMRAIANQKAAAKRNYTKAEAYAGLIELLMDDLKYKVKYAVNDSGKLVGADSFPFWSWLSGTEETKELYNVLYEAGFLTTDYDGYLVLPDITTEVHKKSFFSGDSYSYSYTDFGRKLVSDMQKRALKDGIRLAFYMADIGKGGVHAKERYRLPCSTTSHLGLFFYEWSIV